MENSEANMVRSRIFLILTPRKIPLTKSILILVHIGDLQ